MGTGNQLALLLLRAATGHRGVLSKQPRGSAVEILPLALRALFSCALLPV
jgi:hypothetical protein